MIETYIKAFEVIAMPQIRNAEELIAWQGRAINIIARLYGEDSVQEQQIINIKFITHPSMYVGDTHFGGGNNSKACEKHASEVVQGFITDLKTFGLPDKKKLDKNAGLSISISQNQHQHQKVEVNLILEMIKEELTGKQVKEIEQVLKQDESPGQKKSKLVEKLKSFGSDVASNIVASILTNPNIYG